MRSLGCRLRGRKVGLLRLMKWLARSGEIEVGKNLEDVPAASTRHSKKKRKKDQRRASE